MTAVRYHDATKHHFNRFAPSLGYLDWATQPDPFRRYAGAAVRELPRVPVARATLYPAIYTHDIPAQPINDQSIGEFLRCSMGLSAWKQFGASRWALRVNPSSGNLHPTEAWIVRDGRVFHYAPREHALEERCVLRASDEQAECFLVALTSITWREAWKYGERAFRYCQHDTGHALGALRLAAAMLGWRMHLLTQWSDADIAALLGLDRDADFEGAEREEPECVAVVSRDSGFGIRDSGCEPEALVHAARGGVWSGRANSLSARRVAWPAIDDVALATRYAGTIGAEPRTLEPQAVESRIPNPESRQIAAAARDVILQRRSAVAFNPDGSLSRDTFISMLQRLRPGMPPWDLVDWPPQVNLALFVHRVQDIAPGVYAFLRDAASIGEWKAAMRSEFLWEEVDRDLWLLVPIDATALANRLSCDQDIAADGFFSLGMIARFEEPLRTRGDWFYRRLFWECGLIGQVLYLEAEAAGVRSTGIGCYYDDPVHETLGLSGHAWQSLYHFSMGLPIEDARLTTEPGYAWEAVRS